MQITLQPGVYVLQFLPPASLTEDADMGVFVSIELAIDLVSDMKSLITAAPQDGSCVGTEFPENTAIAPDGSYAYGVDWASIPFSELTGATDVGAVPFTLDRFSLVRWRVGAQYLFHEFDVKIVGGTNVLLHGRISKNNNEIHAVPNSNIISAVF